MNNGDFDWTDARPVDIDQDGQTEVIVPHRVKVPEGAVYVQSYDVLRYDVSTQKFVPVTRAEDGSAVVIGTPSSLTPNGPPTLLDINGDSSLDYFYDPDTFHSDDVPRTYTLSRAVLPGASLLPQAYTLPLPLDYSLSPEQAAQYAFPECGLAPLDYAGHGYANPALYCNHWLSGEIFPDLNGDGLPDIYTVGDYSNDYAITGRLSTGAELWTDLFHRADRVVHPEEQALPPVTFGSGVVPGGDPVSGGAYGQAADFNGDGLSDILEWRDTSNNPKVWLSGNVDSVSTKLTGVPLPHPRTLSPGQWQLVGDFNGDGLPDLAYITDYDPRESTYFANLQVLIQDPSNRDDLVTVVTSDSTELARLNYTSATSAELGLARGTTFDGEGAVGQGVFEPRRGLTVVTGAQLVEGNVRNVYGYYYGNPAADVSGRGFLGFGVITRADVLRSMRTDLSYDHSHFEGTLTNYHVFPFALTPSRIASKTSSDALDGLEPRFPGVTAASSIFEKRTDIQTFERVVHPLHAPNGTLNAGTTFFIENKKTSEVKLGAAFLEVYSYQSREQVYDDFGNVTNVDSTNRPEKSTAVIDYDNDDGDNWIIGRVKKASLTRERADYAGPADSQTTAAAVISYDYDDLSQVKRVTATGAAGATTKTVTDLWRDSAGLVTTVATHDTYGNVRAATFDYSADGVYREHIQDALGHDRWIGFDSGLGVPLISYDANGNRTLYQYDGFGRPRTVSPTRALQTSIDYGRGADGLLITTTQSPASGSGSRVTSLYDSLGNLLETDTKVGSKTSVERCTRDGLERVRYAFTPKFSDTTENHLTVYVYDNLDEVRAVGKPDGSTVGINILSALKTETVSYNPGDGTRHTVVTKTTDGLVASVRENASSGSVATRGVDYVYGQGQELDQVIELGGPTTTYYYQGLPRPGRVVSPDSGETTLQYDGFDNVRHVEHGGAYVSTLDNEYDASGRFVRGVSVQPNPVGGGSPVTGETRRVFDTAPGGIGQLAYDFSPDGNADSYAYTSEGLLSKSTLTSKGLTFSTEYQYDPSGRVSHIDYPIAQSGLARFGVDLAYNDAAASGDGSLKTVTRGTTTYFAALDRGPTGIAESATLAGGLTQTLAIDPATRRVTGISVNSGTTPVYDVGYAYYLGGNISSRTDSLAGTFDEFSYDDFNQLATWSASTNVGTTHETYVYDALGNQTDTGQGSKIFGGTGYSPHQLASSTRGSESHAFGYDPLGRQTSMAGPNARSVTYTAFDLPASITNYATNRTTHYTYDAAQHKVSQEDGTFITTYVGDLYERRVDNASCVIDDVFYVFADGQRVAEVVQERQGGLCIDANTGIGTTHFIRPPGVETTSVLHADVQGSITAATRLGSSPVTTRQGFSPWGERVSLAANATQSAIANVTFGFTDQEHTDAVGLLNLRGRVYDAASRTFLTPDPIVGNPLAVAAWNPYTYVRNNPTKYTDPNGFDPTPAGSSEAADASVDVGDQHIEFRNGVADHAVIVTAQRPDHSSGSGTGVMAFSAGNSTDRGYTPPSVSPAPSAAVIVGNAARAGTYFSLGALEAQVPYGTIGSDLAPPSTAKDRLDLGLGQLTGAASALGTAGGAAAAGLATGLTGIGLPVAAAEEIAAVVVGVGALVNAGTGVVNIVRGTLEAGGGRGGAAEGAGVLGKTGEALDRGGLTKAGRALAKHGGREGSVFPQPTGNPAAINQQGQAALEDILGNVSKTDQNRFGGLDYFGGSRGGGARFDAQGNFIGFLEP